MDSYDVAIVGGGPVGSFAASSILSQNKALQVAVFEHHQKSGFPPHCSGLIGIDGLKKLKIYHSLAKHVSFNQIKAAKFFSPSGRSFIIDRKQNELLVVDRPRLDSLLAKQAYKHGASFQYRSVVKRITRSKQGLNWIISGISPDTRKFEVVSNIIISAEGHHPRILPQAGLQPPSKKWFLPAFQFELENVSDIDRNFVELYFGSKFAPGFFVWLIPLNDSRTRVGLAIHPYLAKGVRKRLSFVTKKHPILSKKLKKSKLVDSWGGFVPASGPIPRTFTNGFMVAGDAAGQTKATTGGGFNIGGYCGYLAGKVAAESAHVNNYSSNFLKKYQQLWQSVFEPELSLMKFFRRGLSFLPDKKLESFFNIAIQTGIDTHMQKIQNIDLHGKALLKYSLTPRVLIQGLRLIPQTVVSLFQGLFI